MLGGFTFKGIHSSTYGVRQTPSSRVLSPLKRRTLITIPGQSKALIQEDGGYEPRVESIICSYAPEDGSNIYTQVRQIAGWLDGVGELTFDYEPDLHYNAFLSSSPPSVTMLEFAQFTLEFTMTHPFAYETANQVTTNVSGLQGWLNTIELNNTGTVKTPVRMIIKNNTNKKITDLKIYHKYTEE